MSLESSLPVTRIQYPASGIERANVKTFTLINYTFEVEMMKRIFAAFKIVPDEDFLKVYYSMRQLLKDEKIRWVDPANMHLTIKFFGETPESKFDQINEILRSISDGITPFTITISKTGIFGSSYKPRVIWFGFDDEELLKEIGKRILNQFDKAGFPADRQNFVPHLTVGRIKQIEHRESFQKVINKFKNIRLQKIRITNLFLFESILKSTGPEYLPLNKFQFT